MMQTYTSANTSVNATKLPKLYRLVADEIKGKNVIDYGCGKFIDRYIGVKANVDGYDPYNYKNKKALERQYDVAICSNVLNVIDDLEARLQVLQTLKDLAPVSYISVYEGDRSGKGRVTKPDCYQLNRSRGDYIPELVRVFGEGNVQYMRKGYFRCERRAV